MATMELPINRLNVCFLATLHLYLTMKRKENKMTDWGIILACAGGGKSIMTVKKWEKSSSLKTSLQKEVKKDEEEEGY